MDKQASNLNAYEELVCKNSELVVFVHWNERKMGCVCSIEQSKQVSAPHHLVELLWNDNIQ